MMDMGYSEIELKNIAVPQAPMKEYPCGLRLHLGQAELDKLGISEVPNVGEKLKLNAVVEVVEVGSDPEKGDEKKYRVALQIQEMELGQDKEQKEKSVVNAMYEG